MIDALAKALRLDDAEHEHLFDLATRAASMTPPPRTQPAGQKLASGTELLLEHLRPYPARVLSRTMDVLAYNPGGLRTLPGIERWPAERHNIARYVFLHPTARDLFADRDTVIGGCVARLRALAGVEPDNPDLTRLIQELLAESAEFAGLWERYEVRPFTQDAKTLRHPEVGGSPSTSSPCRSKAPPATGWSSTTPNRAPPTTTQSSASTEACTSRQRPSHRDFCHRGHCTAERQSTVVALIGGDEQLVAATG